MHGKAGYGYDSDGNSYMLTSHGMDGIAVIAMILLCPMEN